MDTMLFFDAFRLFCLIHTTITNHVEPATVSPELCLLNLSQSSLYKEIEGRIESDGNLRLVRYHFMVIEDNGPFSEARNKDLFMVNQYSATLAIDASAKSFLHLKEYFIPMSLYTLNFSVAEFQIELVQSPSNCLENVSASELEAELKLLIFRNFGRMRSSVISLDGEVCNQYVKFEADKGYLAHNCCKLDTDEQLFCGDLKRNAWTNILTAVIIIVQLLFVLYSPNLVPLKDIKYAKYQVQPQMPIYVRVLKINSNQNENIIDRAFPLPTAEFSKFKSIITGLREMTIYALNVKEIFFFANKGILVDGGTPVHFFSFLKSCFIKCNIRNELDSSAKEGVGLFHICCPKRDPLRLENCCSAKVFQDPCRNRFLCCPVVKINSNQDENIVVNRKHCICCTNGCKRQCSCCIKVYKKYDTWYKCFSLSMHACLCMGLTIPWCFRLWFYYVVEEDSLAPYKKILERNGLTMPYQWQESMVLNLTPFHPIFILCYLMVLSMLIMLLCFSLLKKFDFMSIVLESLERTRATKKIDSFVQFIIWLFRPMEKFGIIGILCFPIWLLFMLTIGIFALIISIFPLLIFFVHLSSAVKSRMHTTRENGKITRVNNIWLWFVEIVFLSGCISMLTIVGECLAFYAEWSIYLLLGIILNSDDVLKFVVLAVSVGFYAHRCFKSVSFEYQEFGNAINKIILKRAEKDILRNFDPIQEKQMPGRAFMVSSKDNNEENISSTSVEILSDHEENEHHSTTEEQTAIKENNISVTDSSYLRWNAKRVVLFLDTDNITYISKKFLFKAANTEHPYSPGPVHILYLDATVQLFWIAMFLVFEIVVISAFGRVYQISSQAETMATLAVGFVPFLFEKVLKKAYRAPSRDVNSIAWKTLVEDTIEKFEEHWYLEDLVIKETPIPGQQISSLSTDTLKDVDLIVKENNEEDKLEFWIPKTVETKIN